MAEQKTFNLILSKVDGPVFTGEVISVTLPGSDGEMTVLASHEALISTLKKGTITIRPKEGDESSIAIEGGTLEISNNQAVILI